MIVTVHSRLYELLKSVLYFTITCYGLLWSAIDWTTENGQLEEEEEPLNGQVHL